jgi:glycosyltransferase involved in cell wall biosynthesis
MKIVALIAVRNEERYIKRCLELLHQEGIEVCLIDNGSTDKTLEIAKQFTSKNVIRIEHIAYNGSFALKPILENKEKLAKEINADWYIHHDADEFRQAPEPYKSLRAAITEVDRQGYNAINFDEFVFLPTIENPDHEGRDYVASMRHYYFFEPRPLRLIKAWKNFGQKVDIVSSGGHQCSFDNRKIFPENFILRHYIALSQAHATAKFCGRVFLEKEVIEDLWHGQRAKCKPDEVILPKASELKEIRNSFDRNLNRSEVWKQHFFVKKSKTSIASKIKEKLVSTIAAYHPGSPKPKETTKPQPKAGPPVPFIIGVEGSGGSFLRSILNGHDELAMASNTLFIHELISKAKHISSYKQFYKILTRHSQWDDFNIDKNKFLQQLKSFKEFTPGDGLRIFYQLYADVLKKKRWGDETPLHDHHILAISNLMPDARFIHVIRDGRDLALAGQGNRKDINIVAQANNWIWRIRDTRRQSQLVSHYLEVRLEDLIENTESVLKGLCNFIELPFSKQMLTSFETPMDIAKIGAWKTEMTNEDRKKFEAIAGYLLRDLEY